MKSKAKRIDNGEWFEGYYMCIDCTHFIVSLGATDLLFDWGDAYEIDPKTLCQQVRGTELFEGDEVERHELKGFIVWNDEVKMFRIEVTGKTYEGETDTLNFFIDDSWKPTGKNIND